MEKTFMQELWRKRFSILVWGVFVMAVIFPIFIFSQDKYEATTDFLVIQNQGASQDMYMLSRSNEYITSVLSEAVYSELFLSEVTRTGLVEESAFPADRQERLDIWKKSVGISKNFQGNILTIKVKGDTKPELQHLSDAIVEVLMKKNNLFRSGSPESVEVKVLSGPLIDRNPSLGLLIVVLVNGFLLGTIIAGVKRYFTWKSKRVPFQSHSFSQK
jgi:capsular polysaccharide biosynthesis protein